MSDFYFHRTTYEPKSADQVIAEQLEKEWSIQQQVEDEAIAHRAMIDGERRERWHNIRMCLYIALLFGIAVLLWRLAEP
jgi:hypothetical protein